MSYFVLGSGHVPGPEKTLIPRGKIVLFEAFFNLLLDSFEILNFLIKVILRWRIRDFPLALSLIMSLQ